MKKILFISNGHGEDMISARIIKGLTMKDLCIDVMPVVGAGKAFEKLKVKVIGPRRSLPGGGFGLRNFSYFIRDIFSGLFGKIRQQVRVLDENKWSYALVIGIGDVVPILYSMITGCKFIFIGVNKSAYYKKLAFNYTWLEKFLLKKYCMMTFTRDKLTEVSLQQFGIEAKYAGNPMMDLVRAVVRGKGSGTRKGNTIGFLPGTRNDASKNIEDFYRIAGQINKADKKVKFILSIPHHLDKERLLKMKSPVKMEMTSDFIKILSKSTVIIGLSGTGNEQAAGVGLPVISFPGRGAQYNHKFASGQKELLGEALMLLPRNSEIIAKEALSLLKSKTKKGKMAKAGISRMGEPGASRKIALVINAYLQSRR
jgi:hypothetical protein